MARRVGEQICYRRDLTNKAFCPTREEKFVGDKSATNSSKMGMYALMHQKQQLCNALESPSSSITLYERVRERY